MTDINGKIAIVTGGASGIGRGIAEQLIAEGASVVIADIEQAALDATAAEIGATGVRVDVREIADIERLRDETLDRHGRVDIVVNNAGVGPISRIRDLTLNDWRWMIEVNLFGVINGVHTFLPVLEANADGGHIVNTSSMASLGTTSGVGPYTAAKSGVTGLSEVLDLELREDDSKVRVTVVIPGTVRTNIGTSQRNREGGEQGGLHDVDIADDIAAGMRWMTPIEVGRVVTHSIRTNDLYAVTHPDWWYIVEEHQRAIRAAFDRSPVEVPTA
ncbi:short-chain type dehydrogenase/reductase [Pseudoclavibacter endophyticus]|uniref:SDR family NAD(P)-dependent oxidoreductase n=1 Tax=Pseudoclavibacter endophyticus TaxID=1778590 RepID=A0A6H9WS81_9MICO|nr:SDR family NAD(P)-dependent oxidoreductase [Pseudoclavibacter endophyticus]KAB1649180.1 SDR family NAD(P)-dependent oxidoreductase [Pseudoclavibacter endophyticus]GGA64804.1 short-chain type dehydrogenase/reductase [Pseudoclavibacter endophyticus]